MAEPIEVIDEIEALTVHCRPPIMSVEQRARWQQDWARDLAKLPLQAIQNAFRQWRQSENTKFPTPGQIIPMIERMSRPAGEAAEGAQVWRYDVGGDEYRSMSLHDKIRHHRIAACHCRRSAGPMPHLGSPIDKADMPPEWHEWRRKAENHDAEAQRLQQSIGRWDQRA